MNVLGRKERKTEYFKTLTGGGTFGTFSKLLIIAKVFFWEGYNFDTLYFFENHRPPRHTPPPPDVIDDRFLTKRPLRRRKLELTVAHRKPNELCDCCSGQYKQD